MYRKIKKPTAVLLFCIMLAGTVCPYDAGNVLAAAQPKLSTKSITVQKGKQKKVTLKKKTGAKKIKWAIGSKKIATIKAKKATVTVKGKKAGQTKLTCRFVYQGKVKKLVCKVKVTESSKPSVSKTTPAPDVIPTPDLNSTSGNPGTSDDSQQLPAPEISEGPDVSGNPGTSGEPDASGNPETSQKPPAQTSSAGTGKPGETGAPQNTATPTPEPAEEGVLLDNDYSDGSTGGFRGRGGAAVKSVVDESIAAVPVLAVTGRTVSWNGAEIDATALLVPGKTYTVSTAVYQKAVSETTIKLTLSYKENKVEKYMTIASTKVSQNQWSGIKTELSVPEGATDLILYVEESDKNDFYVAPIQLFDNDSYDKIVIDDFSEGTLTNFNERSATIEVSDGGVSGKCLKVTGRTNSWNGVSSKAPIAPGASVYVSGYVKTLAEGATLKVSAQGTSPDGKADYPQLLKKELNAGEWTKFSCVKTFNKADYMSLDFVYFELEDSKNAYPDFYLDNVSICVVNGETDASDIQADSTYDITGSLLDSYKPFFGNVGTCMNLSQLNGSGTFDFAKSQYNSITPENETKPDSLLSAGTISVSDAKKNQYYYVPDNYTEEKCPKINYTNIDAYMKKAAENGMRIRFHVFVWHQQTPKWFFKENYDENGDWVSEDVMNARLELYIKSVIKYISMKEQELGYGDVVYCYDVVNEYFHNNNNKDSNGKFYKSYWDEVYYPKKTIDEKEGTYEQTTEPVYVKTAFTYARDILDQYNKTDIKLFYNDFNTYDGSTPNNIIAMMKYVNKEKILCDGIGMQSHLAVTYPTPAYYTAALKKFVASEYIKEVQITELDVTAEESKGQTLETQMAYYYNLMKLVLDVQKDNPGKITGLTFWGLYDSVSWRKEGRPLLFTSTSKAKGVYFKVLQAAAEAAENR
ncbi:MAG: endo-1,4-beta-xylanase [Roseburia sp.]|nr:endo-1,4-beta-xylanase [Roseburia sp.]